jgi:hypothetical protein
LATREAPNRSRATPDTADGFLDGQPTDRPPLLIFIHIPKAAGTTLTTILRMNEPAPRTRHGGNVFKGSGGMKQGVKFARLLRNDSGELDRARVLTGHFPLGMREALPSDLSKKRELRFFTFLREPADRTLSHYYAVREIGRGFGLPPLPAGATLEDALASGYLHDNLQTRMLSGLREPFGEVDNEMLEQAKHNLRDELAFFGLTERFDESLVLAKQRLGLRSILHSPASRSGTSRSRRKSTGRVNTGRPRGDEVPVELRRAAERCNRYDIELYRYAEQLFDAAPERSQLDFEIELAALRAAKADGEIELDAPPPESYSGDEHSWRMLLHARASSMRNELEHQKLLRSLERIRAAGKSTPGRDAETAMRVIQMLAPAGSEAPADAAPAERPRGPGKTGGRQPAKGGKGRQPRSRKSGKSADA